MFDVDYVIFVSYYWNIVLSVDRTYNFTSGMIILNLTYWSYSQMDVCFR